MSILSKFTPLVNQVKQKIELKLQYQMNFTGELVFISNNMLSHIPFRVNYPALRQSLVVREDSRDGYENGR